MNQYQVEKLSQSFLHFVFILGSMKDEDEKKNYYKDKNNKDDEEQNKLTTETITKIIYFQKKLLSIQWQ